MVRSDADVDTGQAILYEIVHCTLQYKFEVGGSEVMEIQDKVCSDANGDKLLRNLDLEEVRVLKFRVQSAAMQMWPGQEI